MLEGGSAGDWCGPITDRVRPGNAGSGVHGFPERLNKASMYEAW